LSQALPDKASVLKKTVLANDYFMKEYPDSSQPIVTNVSANRIRDLDRRQVKFK
jgi:hypothetical protein